MTEALSKLTAAPKNIVKGLLAYITIVGLVTLSLFMMEEAFQTAMFGTWPAQDAQQWDVVYEGTELMASIVNTMNIVNYACGWVQPLAFVAYRAYIKSARFYVKSLRAKILAHEPSLFVGQRVAFRFVPRERVRMADGSWELRHGRIRVLVGACGTGKTEATGVLAEVGGQLVVDTRP